MRILLLLLTFVAACAPDPTAFPVGACGSHCQFSGDCNDFSSACRYCGLDGKCTDLIIAQPPADAGIDAAPGGTTSRQAPHERQAP